VTEVNYALRLHFLDSDCTIIEHPSGNLTMVDMGTTGETDPVDYYRQHFWPRQLFRFIATHPDMDHISGLTRLADAVSVANFWYVAPNVPKDDFEGSAYDQEDWLTFQKLVHGRLSACPVSPKSGQTGHFWTDDNIHIWAPSVEDERVAERSNQPNLASYILAIRHGKGFVVLGGDAEADTWQRLYETYRWPPGVTVTVLKAPHHGHDTALYEPVMATMRPRLTIVTSDSDRQHDGSDLYQRYSGTVLRTDVHGNIVVTVRPDGSATYDSDLIRTVTASFLAPPPLFPWPVGSPAPRAAWLDPPHLGPPPPLRMPPWPPRTRLP
jgi:competence protein ComEC